MAINDPTDIANLFAWFRGDSGVENASDLPAQRAEKVKDWDDSEVPIATTQAADARRPFFYDKVVGGQAGVSFRGTLNNMVLQSTAAHEQVGDLTIAIYQAETWRHRAAVGQYLSHGLTSGAEDEVENETYDVRTSSGKMAWFHENGVGVNNLVTSTLDVPSYPSGLFWRRDISTNEITFDVGSSTETLGYSNDATGGTSGRLHIGGFGSATAPASDLFGDILEIVIYTRELTNSEITDLNDYFAARYEQRTFTISQDSSFNIGSVNVQTLYTDGIHIWVADGEFLYKYTVAGSLVDSRDTTGTSLDSWGGTYVHNGFLYLVRFSESVPSQIWRIEADDLATGNLEVVQGLSAIPENGINGLERLRDGNWVCGLTKAGSNPNRQHKLYRLNSTFDYIDEIDIPAINNLGVQDFTTGPYGDIYMGVHGEGSPNATTIYRLTYENGDFSTQWLDTLQYNSQGLAWDPIARKLYTGERAATDTVKTNTLIALGGLQVECLGGLINA